MLSLRSELLRSFGFRHGFSLRHGGVSVAPYDTLNLGRTVGDDPVAVAQNHLRFAAEVGYDPDRLYEVSQVHGRTVARAQPQREPEDFRKQEADALVSLAADCAIGIRVADCAAVLVVDTMRGGCAAIHAGWRGVVADVVGATLARLLEDAGGSARDLAAAIFPCIGPAAFEVGDDVAQQVAHAAGDERVVQWGAAKPHVDLSLSVRRLLERAGLASERIEQVAGCTYSEPSRFFSYRRDQGVTGRHLAVVVPRC
jgi:polyphenol oxidase